MDISMSNIAWNVELDNDIALLLNKFNIKNIDIAPPQKIFPLSSLCKYPGCEVS
ncbi:hypothetical protein EDB37_1015104 [Vibrio crassostreae]|nr:hypothetical protein EDB37_1015104 [Vibrio crassostreae]